MWLFQTRSSTYPDVMFSVEVCGAHARVQFVAHVLQTANSWQQLHLVLHREEKIIKPLFSRTRRRILLQRYSYGASFWCSEQSAALTLYEPIDSNTFFFGILKPVLRIDLRYASYRSEPNEATSPVLAISTPNKTSAPARREYENTGTCRTKGYCHCFLSGQLKMCWKNICSMKMCGKQAFS